MLMRVSSVNRCLLGGIFDTMAGPGRQSTDIVAWSLLPVLTVVESNNTQNAERKRKLSQDVLSDCVAGPV